MVLWGGSCGGGLVKLDSAILSPGDSVLTITKHSLIPGNFYMLEAEMTPYTSGTCRTCVDSIVVSSICLRQEGDPPFCGFDPVNNLRIASGPGYTIQMTAQDQYIYNYVHSHTNIAGPFTIPVVVHVLHYGNSYGSGNNISYDQILWQIAGMNAAFQHDYANYNQQTYGHNYLGYGYQDYSSNPQVRFCLATIGRDAGLNQVPFYYNTMAADTEYGVMRYDLTQAPYTSVANIDSLHEYRITSSVDEQALLDVTRPGSEFPNGMYLNIYVVPDLCDGGGCNDISDGPTVVGIGYMGAFQSLTGQLDGVVFRSDVFGDNSVTGNNFPLFPFLNQGKIMDHEAGHYLSLYHTFQPDSLQPLGCWGVQDTLSSFDRCDQHGDYCCDTPPDTNAQTIPYFPTNFINSCNEVYFTSGPANHRDMNEAYMDYSDDDYYNTFTFDQSMRISAMLDTMGPRHSLVTPINLALTGVSNIGACHCCILAAQIIPSNDSSCIGSPVNFFTPSGTGFCATSWLWTFPGGTPSSASGTSASTTYNAAGDYWAYLTATNGVDSITDSVIVHVIIPTVTILRTNTTDTVCSGTHQNIYLRFTGTLRPYNISICDQSNNVVATMNNIYADSAIVLVPVSLTSNVFHICSATNGLGCQVDTVVGHTSFLVMECCANLFVDGDFEAYGTPSCNISPSTTEHICGGYANTHYYTYNPTAFALGWPVVPGNNGVNGLSMVIDGYPAPVHTTPINHTVLWSQPVPLEQGVHYSVQFDYSGHHWGLGGYTPLPSAWGRNLWLQLKVNGTFIGSPIHVPDASYGTPWHTFVMDYTKTSATSTDTISLCQVEVPFTGTNFNGNFFDYMIDNMTIRAKDIPFALAGMDTVICPGNFAYIGSLQNDSDGVYAWSPTTFVACGTCLYTTVTPIASNNYILTNHQRGCIVYDTVAVQLLNVNAGADIAYCSGGSSTISPVITAYPGSYTVLWQPGGQTTDSITVSPTTTTTYIITVTDTISNCSDSDTITVFPGNLNVTLNDTSYCIGNAAVLNPTVTGNIGGLTYLWLPGNQTTPSISVFPSTATTYTVIVTDSIGCSDTATATVTPGGSVTVSATASPDTACFGATIQLTANATGTGTLSYSWLPTTGLSSSTIFNPIISSYTGSPTTYTVQVTNNLGCSSSAIVSIVTDSICCVAPNIAPDTLTNITLTGGSWAVNSTLYINGTVTFNGVDMKIASGVAIIELPSSTLHVTGQSHLYACRDMWAGIEEGSNSTTVVDQNSLIEDAHHSLRTANNAPSTTICSQAIFNRNYIDIDVQAYNGLAAVSLTNCRFTCRQLPSNPTVASLTSAALTALPSINLKAPLNTIVGLTAVYTQDVGTLNVGTPSVNMLNIMDNIQHGIYGFNTDVISYNNQYQNMRGQVIICPGPPAPCPPTPGIAILLDDPTMVPGTTSTHNSVTVGGAGLKRNYFVNCYQAVNVTDYVHYEITNDTIFSTATIIAPPAATNLNGGTGIYIRTRLSLSMNIRLNGIVNQANSVHVMVSNGGVNFNSFHINRNHISAQSSSTTFTNNGIWVEGNIGVLMNQANFIFVDSNTVLNARTPIWVRNFTKCQTYIENNPELFIRPNANSGPGPNSAGVFVQNMNRAVITSNPNIHSTGTTYSNVNHRNIRGIYVMSTTSVVACNVVHHTGQSIVFEGTCYASVWKKNDMSFAYDGFVLRNNAVLGPQGNNTHPIDNRWLGGSGSFVFSQTLTENTTLVNTNSPIWVRSTGVWNPTNNLTIGGSPYIPNTVGSTFIAATCPPPTIGENNPNAQALRDAIAQDQVALVTNPQEARVEMQKKLYSEIQDDPNLLVGDTILQNFSSDNQSSNVGLMEDVEDQSSQGDLSNAAGANSAISPGTMSETNQKQLNEILISTLMVGNYDLTPQQLADLWAIAEQCPSDGGVAVWEAQSTLNWVLQDALEFSDSCAPSSARMAHPDHTGGSNSLTAVYPNPNAGNVTVIYSLQGVTSARFEVCDVTGRVLFSMQLDPKSSQKNVILTGLANGAYIYKLIGDEVMVSTGTLIIAR